VVFAVALLLPRHLMIPFTGALFATAAAAGFIFDFDSAVGKFYTESYIMEFVAGMVIGHLWLHERLKLPALPALAAIPVAIVALVALTPLMLPQNRLLVWGIPAALIVTAGLSLDLRGMSISSRFLRLMGDASYSIYLTHILTLGVLRTVWSHLGLIQRDLGSACVFLAVSIAVSVLVGVAVYYAAEVPMMRFFRRVRFAGQAGAPLAAGATTR